MESPASSSSILDLQQIAARLREAVEELEISASEFAGRCRTPYSTYRAYSSSQRAPSAEFLAQAFSEFGLMPSWLLTGVGPRWTGGAAKGRQSMDEGFVVIPHYEVTASAGTGAAITTESEVGGLSFSRKWLAERGLNPASLKIIDVAGQSMEGKLFDGDKMLVNLDDTTPKSGRAYVLRQDGELLVKYCQLLPGGMLRVSSENDKFPPYDIDLSRTDGVSILGRVKVSMHEW